jgi:predicted amidophosphoribosyltransferase
VTESLVELGLAVICETCESEIEPGTDPAEGICRQCGLAFLVEPDAVRPDLSGAEPATRSMAS